MSNPYIKQVESIMQSEVSRAEFIKYIGVAFIGILGVTSFIRNLSKNIGTQPKASTKSNGFGGSVYGR